MIINLIKCLNNFFNHFNYFEYFNIVELDLFLKNSTIILFYFLGLFVIWLDLFLFRLF